MIILPSVKLDGKSGNSYQKRSPYRRDWNCRAIMQPNVGPINDPSFRISETPPDHKSISCGDLKQDY